MDCGGLLPQGVVARDVFVAAEKSSSWINRRVLSIRLREDGCTYERTSLDLVAPVELLGTQPGAAAPRQIVLPLTWWWKRADIHRVDFRGSSGDALPLVHNEQQAALAVALMCSVVVAEVRLIPEVLYHDVCVLTRKVVVEPAATARGSADNLLKTWATLGLSSDCLIRLKLFITQFVEAFLVAVVVRLAPDSRHVILKYNMGHGMPLVVPPPEEEGLWGAFRTKFVYPTRIAGWAWLVHPEIAVDDSDYRIAKTTHFEFEVTGDTLIRRLEAQLPGVAIPALIDRTQSVASLEVRPVPTNAVQPASAPPRRAVVSWRAHVIPKKSALTNGARYLAGFGFATLGFFAIVSVIAWNYGFSAGLFDDGLGLKLLTGGLAGVPDPTGAMQVLTGVIALGSLFAGRSREHWVTSFVLRPFRWVAFFTGVNLSVVAVIATPIPIHLWWVFLVPALIVQGYVINRSIAISGYVGHRGRALRR
jgi:hypothetical protein